MSMIEKMARAIRRSILMKSNEVAKLAGIHSKVLSDEEMEKKIDELWHVDASEAKAALECLKEPTKDMKAEMAKFTGSQDIAHECFRLGIRAALEGK